MCHHRSHLLTRQRFNQRLPNTTFTSVETFQTWPRFSARCPRRIDRSEPAKYDYKFGCAVVSSLALHSMRSILKVEESQEEMVVEQDKVTPIAQSR
jgi:hypothetical protein